MSSGNIVKLNIGGSIFQTTKSTLTKFDGFFKTILETGVPLEKDDSGAIFIDRSPKHFELILNYMRDGSVSIPDSKTAAQEIQTEAQYYLLDGLVKLCNSQKSVTKESKNRCLKTDQEVINAVINSTKKVVFLVPYQADIGIHVVLNGFQSSKFLVKCSEDFDVYFYAHESSQSIRLYDKITGRSSSVYRYDLDKFLKENYGVE